MKINYKVSPLYTCKSLSFTSESCPIKFTLSFLHGQSKQTGLSISREEMTLGFQTRHSHIMQNEYSERASVAVYLSLLLLLKSRLQLVTQIRLQQLVTMKSRPVFCNVLSQDQ
jgi:hypothetical protein